MQAEYPAEDGMDDIASVSEDLKGCSSPMRNPQDLDAVLDHIGDAHITMLGEASHGTHEYYMWRSEISKRLIEEKGFRFIAVEGDWPDCYKINRFIKGDDGDHLTSEEVLEDFKRWPSWMWANQEIKELMDWLLLYNKNLPQEEKVGFYGLDVYSLWDSLRAVRGYIKERDPEALPFFEEVYNCFGAYGENPHEYGRVTSSVSEDCRHAVIDLLKHMVIQEESGKTGREDRFDAEQNAYVVKNAEDYYRTMFKGEGESWNVRDQHMEETLKRLLQFYGEDSKCIVWAHNTHIGDARATDMAIGGMFNIGQLAREELGDKGVVLVGFGSYEGSVIASSEWDGPVVRMTVPSAQPRSWEDIMHRTFNGNTTLFLDTLPEKSNLHKRLGHRAIGVVYNPSREKGNYVPTKLASRYDIFIFLDKTEALTPIHTRVYTEDDLEPETFPFGF